VTDKGRREQRRQDTAGTDFIWPQETNCHAGHGPQSPHVICTGRRIFSGESWNSPASACTSPRQRRRSPPGTEGERL